MLRHHYIGIMNVFMRFYQGFSAKCIGYNMTYIGAFMQSTQIDPIHIVWQPLHFVRIYEPSHDKNNTVAVRPAKTQISLGIRLTLIRLGGRPG